MTIIVGTFGVSAGVYRESNPKSCLTHACAVGDDGFPISVLCSRVKIESILEDTSVATNDPPSCATCQAKLTRIEHEWFRYDLEPNHPASKLEWVKGDGVDRDGHNLTWWKNKVAKWKSQYDRPTVFIQVLCWDRSGESVRPWPQFDPAELKEAKAWAKQFVESTGGSCRLDGRVEIPHQGTITIELGQWKNSASNGFYVWSVDQETQMPVTRRGPFTDYDEAVQVAKQAARGGQTYDEVVTFGGDPEAGDFSIEKSFKAWSGEVHYQSDLARVGGRLRELRR